MIITKGIKFRRILEWSGMHMLWLLAYMTTVALLYRFEFITVIIPWLPVSIIGTSVAFYVGFKNSQAYDRMWEARKIWGGIVNDSRTWGMMVNSYITNLFSKDKKTTLELQEIKKRLIYRHFAWLYTHRLQLLVPTPWEHISQGGHLARLASVYQKHGVGLLEDVVGEDDMHKYLTDEEFKKLKQSANMATQLINHQSRDLAALREEDVIDDFRHMEMTNVLRSFYELQGKNERIKKFPFPRQYANMSRYFVGIFIFLLPYSMVPELLKMGEFGFAISIPISALIGWAYIMMELVGDYSENPFQGMGNDIPMMSICRTIEIDMREMLGETDLPKPIKAKDGVLM